MDDYYLIHGAISCRISNIKVYRNDCLVNFLERREKPFKPEAGLGLIRCTTFADEIYFIDIIESTPIQQWRTGPRLQHEITIKTCRTTGDHQGIMYDRLWSILSKFSSFLRSSSENKMSAILHQRMQTANHCWSNFHYRKDKMNR